MNVRQIMFGNAAGRAASRRSDFCVRAHRSGALRSRDGLRWRSGVVVRRGAARVCPRRARCAAVRGRTRGVARAPWSRRRSRHAHAARSDRVLRRTEKLIGQTCVRRPGPSTRAIVGVADMGSVGRGSISWGPSRPHGLDLVEHAPWRARHRSRCSACSAPGGSPVICGSGPCRDPTPSAGVAGRGAAGSSRVDGAGSGVSRRS
jgi:hypothetical protein